MTMTKGYALESKNYPKINMVLKEWLMVSCLNCMHILRQMVHIHYEDNMGEWWCASIGMKTSCDYNLLLQRFWAHKSIEQPKFLGEK